MLDIIRAVGLFAVTNVDDIVLLALFFARGVPPWRVVLGQYLGFAGILAVAVAAALGATLLPPSVLPWLGLLPLALGVKAAWQAWRGGDDPSPVATGALGVAAVTFANGGDNIGVYVPVFATTGITGYVIVFLVLVAVWCGAGRYFATRPAIAHALTRWGHVVLPVVLILIGVLILLGV
ncbi:cadmium resistance protein CadD (predicted permease) [Saccharothrix saharensis]|uniref:Cadmium resistance protein CadD (Predicted permease) n=1 Tax=Saccharothrix saharensis TaxID=571190 RepID=A0A543JK04_9PSEU|nr:cadmium resistance transporter [Saccharothrix saharensis]TQM83190.1 cadmium resistance protein CadD (predicted permease) [Saccharothrix saharensis]